MPGKRLRFGPILIPFLALAGCASVSVAPTPMEVDTRDGKKPAAIILSDFDYTAGIFLVDRDGYELKDFEESFSRALTADIAEQLKPIYRVQLASEKKTPDAAWLVVGHIRRANQGSRALRSLIGFGSGGTKLETSVEVYDMTLESPLPIFTFDTTGGSGSSPGAVLSSNPYTFAASAAEGTLAGLSDDRQRTARMIAAYLSEQLALHGYLADQKVIPAKRLGSWAAFEGQYGGGEANAHPASKKRNGVKSSSK